MRVSRGKLESNDGDIGDDAVLGMGLASLFNVLSRIYGVLDSSKMHSCAMLSTMIIMIMQ